MDINHIRTERLRNDAHFQFHTITKRLMSEHDPQVLKVGAMFAEYSDAYNKEDEAIKKIVKSIHTDKIKDADKARDSIWSGLVTANKAALKHPSPAVQESARNIKIVLDTYGNIAKKSFLEQTSATTNVLQDLESAKYAPHVATVGLLPWVVELKARNIALANLAKDRMDERSVMVSTVTKEARAQVDKIYHAIVKHINARAEVEGVAVYEPFIRKMNENIAEFITLMAHAPKRSKKGKPEDAADSQSDGGAY